MDKATKDRLKKAYGGPVAHVEPFAGWDMGQWVRIDVGKGQNALHLYVPAAHPLARAPTGAQIKITALV